MINDMPQGSSWFAEYYDSEWEKQDDSKRVSDSSGDEPVKQSQGCTGCQPVKEYLPPA